MTLTYLRTVVSRLISAVVHAPIGGVILFSCAAFVAPVGAGESPPDTRFFSMPLELDFDSGADNGDAAFLKFAPLYSTPLNDDWSLININLIMLIDAPGGVPGSAGNPEPSEGNRAFGLGDVTHLSIFTPRSEGNFIYGMGFMLSLPTATDPTLGSEKWTAGPAFRVTYRQGPWNVGVFGGNHWSYDGANDRGDISQLMLRGTVRRSLANSWFLVSAPVITANWKAQKSSDTWMLPLGGGIGKVFNVDSARWALSLQAYANVVKPDGAPDWVIRFGLIVPVSRAAFGL